MNWVALWRKVITVIVIAGNSVYLYCFLFTCLISFPLRSQLETRTVTGMIIVSGFCSESLPKRSPQSPLSQKLYI